MTGGAEVVCNKVVREVELVENDIGGVVTADCNVGGYEEDGDCDYSYVVVSGGIALSAGETVGVNADEFIPKSDSADEIGQFKKKESGEENLGMLVNQLVLETDGMAHGSTTVSDDELKDFKDCVNLENGSAVDPPVGLVVNANGHLDNISVEQQEDVKSTEEMNYTNEIKDVEVKSDDTEAEASLETETNIEAVNHENTSSENGVSNCIDKPQECNNNKLQVKKDNDSLSNPDDLSVVEQKVEIEPHLGTENVSAEVRNHGTEIVNVDVSNDDDEKETQVKDAEDVPHIVTYIISAEGMASGTGVENVVVSNGNDEKEAEVKDAHVESSHHSDEIPNSSVDADVNDDIDLENEEGDLSKYNFLVKIPRFEDETFRDQIRSARAKADEKTRLLNSILVEIQEKRANMLAYTDEYNAVKTEDIAAKLLVRAKRQEIEAVQAVIDRWKNAMAVEDIDARIYGVEHMIQHETVLLTDEEQFIRVIRQLKSLRDELASGMGTPEEIRHAIDTKDQNEERLKILRQELEPLKAEVSKIDSVLRRIVKKYQEESRKEIELKAQFRAADVLRHEAYAHLNSLKKQSYDKNQNFREFKKDVTEAKGFASQKNKEALDHLCANQVETFMAQWNNDDEFRNEYVSRLNMIALRKQKDGAPPVVNDVAPSNANDRNPPVPIPIPGEVEQIKNVSSTEHKNVVNGCISKSIENVQMNLDMAKEEAELADNNNNNNNNILTKEEEIELAKKAEEEMAVKLKEQRRVEEKAKAVEALERKKRNAEKAQLRAEVRARKEAEQKEKEKEKRLRKKEQKKTDGNEATTKEIEKKKSQKPPAHFFSKQLKPKPVPPPLLNKNKKRLQQFARVAFCLLSAVFVFLMVNSGILFNFKASQLNIKF